MFAKWFHQNVCPIGIDFSAHSIKMLQMGRDESGRWQVRAKAEHTLSESLPATGPQRTAALKQALLQMLSQGPFVGKRVVASLPTDSIQFKNLRLPKMPPDELQTAVEWEAADRLNLSEAGQEGQPAGPAYLQYFDAGEVHQGEELRQEVILMAAPATVVHDHLDALLGAGLEPLAVECAPAAMERYLSDGRVPDVDAPADVAIDIGFHSSKVLIARANRVVFFKFIQIGGRRFNELVARRLNISADEADDLRRKLNRPAHEQSQPVDSQVAQSVLEACRPAAAEVARELSLCLRYYSVTFRGRRPEKALFLGGESDNAWLVKLLCDEAGIEPAPTTSGALDGVVGGAWIVAAGLSMRPWPRGVKSVGAKAVGPAPKAKEAA